MYPDILPFLIILGSKYIIKHMKKWALLTMMMFLLTGAFAQDLIVQKNGTTLKVKILKSDPEKVEYKIPEIYGDSILQKNKSEILTLVFENGYTEIIDTPESKSRKNQTIEHPANKLSFDAFGFLGREVYFQYERLIPNKAIAIRVPFGFNYNLLDGGPSFFINSRSYMYDLGIPEGGSYTSISHYDEKGFGIHSGASVVVFFNGPKKVRGYIAPGLVMGVFNKKNSGRILYHDDSWNVISEKEFKQNKSSFIIGTDVKLGFSIMTNSKVSVGIETGGGYGAIIQDDGYGNKRLGMWRFSVLLGYSWGKKKSE